MTAAEDKTRELLAAFEAFSKVLCLPGGPSLAVQQHNPSWEAWKQLCDAFAATPSTPLPEGGEVERAFAASDAACYLWPDDTDEHRALRAAYIRGAADSAPAPQAGVTPDEMRELEMLANGMGFGRTHDALCKLMKFAASHAGVSGTLEEALRVAAVNLTTASRVFKRLGHEAEAEQFGKAADQILEALRSPAPQRQEGWRSVWFRQIDAGTKTARWIDCAKDDPGAIEFFPASPAPAADTARQ